MEYRENIEDIKEKAFSYISIALISLFFVMQPISKSITKEITTILLVIGLITLIKNRGILSSLISYKKAFIFSTLFFITALLSTLNSPYKSTVTSLEPELRILLLPLLVAAIYSAKFQHRHLVLALSFAAWSYAIVSFNQTNGLSLSGRAHGNENAVGFGNSAMLLAIVSFYYALDSWKIDRKLWLLSSVSFLLFTYSTIASGTRGSFLVIPIVFIFSTLYFGKVKLLIAGIFFGIIGSWAIYQNQAIDRLDHTVSNIEKYISGENKKSSLGVRLELWKTSICIMKKYPILGAGTHSFKEATQDNQLGCDFNESKNKQYFVQAHSLYFNTLATMGITGLLSLLLFGLYICRESLKISSRLNHIPTIIILSIAAYTITVDILFSRFLADKHTVLIATTLALILRDQSSAENQFNS